MTVVFFPYTAPTVYRPAAPETPTRPGGAHQPGDLMPYVDLPTEPLPRVRARVTQIRPEQPRVAPDYGAWVDSLNSLIDAPEVRMQEHKPNVLGVVILLSLAMLIVYLLIAAVILW